MQLLKRKDVPSVCPKTGKYVLRKTKYRWLIWVFPIAGLVSLIWFLIRVLPKPSRAMYPCQRVAFPLASGFVVWVLGLVGSGAALKKAKLNFARRRYILGLICVAVSVGAIWLAFAATGEKVVLAEPQPVNQPMGEGKGIHPGRVVWVHDPEATNWDGAGDGHPWESNHTSQTRVNQMMSGAIQELTGEASDAAAWDRLFRYHNKTRGKGNVGYKPGEKIVIKVNFVGFIWRHGGVNPSNYNLETKRDYMNTSPQMLIALLRQLVNKVGVREADIGIADSLAYFANEYYNIFYKEFPNLRCLDYTGKFGRIRMKQSSVPFHWSCNPKGRNQDYVPVSFAEADYLINFANLKAHTGAGVTLCAKNHYGSLIRWPAQKGYYDMHSSAFARKVGVYRALVDLMGHAHIGGKTVLYLIDGLYCGIHPIDMDRGPRRWKSYPFNGDWTSSLLASQDPVAIDSVGFDFLYAEYDDPARRSGVDDYLQEAALAHNPPSGTFYDPDHSGNVKRLASLGVHEHWNNPKDKQYSRNLGCALGIELVAVTGAHKKEPPRAKIGTKVAKTQTMFAKKTEWFNIKTHRQVFNIGEPVLLEYELIASEDGSRTLIRFQGTRGYLLPFGVAGPDDRRARYQLHVRMMKPHSLPAKQFKLRREVIEEEAVERFKLAPGERRKGEIDVSKAYHLDQPGEYDICIHVGKNFVVSNQIRIQVGSTIPSRTVAEKPGIIAQEAKVKKLADVFKFTEGPAVDAEGNVFFTDQPNNRIHKWSVDGKLSIFHEKPGRANGLYFDKKGNLLACADLNNQLWSIDPKGKVTVLVKGYKGKKLNGPNDLWIDRKGGIYFTDPFYKRPYWNRGPMEQDGQHVYYLSPNGEKLIRLTNDLVQPNGIIGTPDGKLLYVADIGARKTYVYNINADGTLSAKKLFCSMGSDGMTIDNEGNVYLTGKGVTVFNSAGEKIEHIDIPAGWTANVCFGGKDRHTLFITAQTSLYSLRMRVKGI